MFVSFLQFLGLLRALFARPLSPSQPSPVPSAQPSSSPSAQPSAEPSTQPSSAPSSQPITAYLFEYLTVEYQLKMDARNILLIWVYILVTIVLLSMGTYYSYGWYGVPVGEMWLASEVWVKPVGAVVYSLLEKNPFVQVVIFGSLTAYAYVLANTLYRLLVLPLFTGLQCNVVIHNDDPNFNAIMDYVADSLLQSSSASYSLQANTKVKEMKTRKDYIAEWLGSDTNQPQEFVYRPDNDQVIHVIYYLGRKIFLERSKSATPLMGRDKPFTPESLKITTWGSDNTVLKQLMADALHAASQQLREGTVSIYTLSNGWCSGWELALTRKARPRESVILDMDDMEVLLEDARTFLRAGKWYSDMGIPYRRGYLLHGPPGCGKTSFAQVLAGELQLDLCILNLTHQGLTDNGVAEYLRDAPANSIIVLEDIDAIFVERTASKAGKGDHTTVSFSGLLNALDGIASQEGRLLFMTTNHIEKLDPALIRPGRCDLQLQLKLASKNQILRMFLRFFPTEEALAADFAASLPAHELSMATLQGYFLRHRTASDCAAHAADLLSSRALQLGRKSLFEHLRRVGCERYAAALETQGITAEDLSGLKVDDLLKHSEELRYDPGARRMLARLIEGDEQFLGQVYSLAEVPHMRELFLAAYAGDAGDAGDAGTERGLSPSSPLAPSASASASPLSPSSASASSLSPPFLLSAPVLSGDAGTDAGVAGVGADAGVGAGVGAGVVEESYPPESPSTQQLSDLSKSFCTALSSSGKGTVSIHNIRRLLDAHPARPSMAVAAAAHFTRPRLLGEKIASPVGLYGFLRRLGLGPKVHAFLDKDVFSLRDLRAAHGADKVALMAVEAAKAYKVTPQEALRLAEVLLEQQSETANLTYFALHSRSRVADLFELYYQVPGAFAPGGVGVGGGAGAGAGAGGGEGAGADKNKSKDKGKDKGKAEEKGVDRAVGGLGYEEHKDSREGLAGAAAGAGTGTGVGAVVALSDRDTGGVTSTSKGTCTGTELKQTAFQFAVAVTDELGTATVSLLQVLDHLRRHTPASALLHANALVSPPYPAAPRPAPKQALPIEWVDLWFEREHRREAAAVRAVGKEGGKEGVRGGGGKEGNEGSETREGENRDREGREDREGRDSRLGDALPDDLRQYTEQLKAEGFRTLHDLLTGPPLTPAELLSLGVDKLSHRRRIAQMHLDLLQEHGIN